MGTIGFERERGIVGEIKHCGKDGSWLLLGIVREIVYGGNHKELWERMEV